MNEQWHFRQFYASSFVATVGGRLFVVATLLFPVHKQRSIKTCFNESGVKQCQRPAYSPDLNPAEQLWEELEHWLQARYSGHKFPQTHCKMLWLEALYIRKGWGQFHINAHGLGMACPTSSNRCDSQVCRYFWPYTVYKIMFLQINLGSQSIRNMKYSI